MMPRLRISARLYCAWAAVLPAFAAPPTVNFLTPQQFIGNRGDSVPVRLLGGAARSAQPVAWPDDVSLMLVRGGGTQENQHDVRPAAARDDFVRVTLNHPDVTLVGIDRRPILLDLSGAELRDFTLRHTSGRVATALPLEDQTLRVRHTLSSKTYIRAVADGRPATASALAVAKTGQPVELLPLIDPTLAHVGSDLPVIAYADSGKIAGVQVLATHVPSGKTTGFVADSGGSGWFRITDSGLWRVEFHYVRTITDAAADWAIDSATLSFEVPPQKGAGQ
jgi:hypothetical protein